MNREFKFRVWNTISKSFLEIKDDGGWGFYYITLGGKLKFYDYGCFGNPTENVEVTTTVIQQYTDLLDKNGKEIYEGDLIKYNIEGYDKIGPGTIEFFAGMFICSWKDQTDDELGYMMIDDIEVIGNIFEKTDL